MNTPITPVKNGFTLTELLVVLATLSVLAMLLVPALASTKPHSQAIQCLDNERRLALAWQMYAQDNRGKLAPNGDEAAQPTSPTDPTLETSNLQWCPGVMEFGAQDNGPTNTALIMAGCIYPYVKAVGVYRCPADVSTTLIYGRLLPRVRSVAMNCWLNPLNIWNASANGRAFRTDSDLGVLGAANVWLVMDENPYGIDDAYMAEYPPPGPGGPARLYWVEYPAAYHNGAAGISFCDGHVMLKKWTDQTVLSLRSQSPPNMPPNPANCPDLPWLQSVSTRSN
ncbi:MAG TPA: type II secretion system protein [Candidatus Acidoferrales bacterium]|nr:type II secretion system protein [Candidatus Acidoferrales bacterium]